MVYKPIYILRMTTCIYHVLVLGSTFSIRYFKFSMVFHQAKITPENFVVGTCHIEKAYA